MNPAGPSSSRRICAWAEAHPLTAIGLFLLLVLGPFLNKAVHMDDPMYLWAAEHILKDPLNFYGFTVNWTGAEIPMSVEMCNPPATSYFFAAVLAVFGFHEVALHGAMLLVTFAAAAGVYRLAERWCAQPLLATAVVLVSPVFLVSATTLMCDLPLLAAWMWTMVFWDRALEQGRPRDYLAAMLLASLSVLIKYSALPLLPLLPILGWLRERRFGGWLLWLLLPAALIGAYEFLTARMYGQGLIASASEYAARTRFLATGGVFHRLLLGLTTAGGGLLSIVLLAPWLWNRRQLAWGGGALLLASLGLVWGTEAASGLDGWVRLQVALLAAAGMHLLLVTLRQTNVRDDISLMLGLWAASVFVFAGGLNWTVSARSFLPLAPAVAIMAVRSLVPAGVSGGSWLRRLPALAVSFLISVLVMIADQSLADSGRAAAGRLSAQLSMAGKTLWFQGHRGFQFYLQRLGGRPVDLSASVLPLGEWMVMPANGNNLITPEAADFERSGSLRFEVCNGCSPAHPLTGAGFYGGGGWLPFTFGLVPPEDYLAFRALRLTSFAPPEVLNNLAWELATSPHTAARDGGAAVDLARLACERTHDEWPVCLGTLAAAYAEAGRFEEAMATAQKAADLASSQGQSGLQQKNLELLALYRQGKAYHQPVSP